MSLDNNSKTIVIDRMYAGSYLDDNIGHEIINTYQTDAGENYIYINPWGIINQKAKNTEYVLLVRLINQHCMEVLAYAGDLQLLLSDKALEGKQKDAGEIDSKRQLDLVADNKIMYGGVYLNNLLSEQRNTVFVTFRSNRYRMARKQFYIVDTKEEIKNENHFYIPGINFSKQSLRMYFYENEHERAYKELKRIIEEMDLWQNKNNSRAVDLNKPTDDTSNILDIIKKTDDELSYSNWISYYLDNDPKLFCSFAEEVLGVSMNTSPIIRREYFNIDIWLEDKDNVVVIENKLKSGINGVDSDRHDIKSDSIQSQLSKYVEIAEKEADGRTPHYYIFLPDYSYPDEELKKYTQGEKYQIIRYSSLYNFFGNISCELPYYSDFIKALKKHTSPYRKDLFEIMDDKLIQTIIRKR
ncbi:MAG: hypothetical protein IJI66_12610 [Erysipelotrichaceae bacterium]|nr:hypothetical protein [Erysipelotrichaceae bacterium]